MSTEDMSVLLTLLEAIPPVPATELLKGGMVGTFFSIQNPSWPPLPGNVNKLSVWPLQKDSYLLDDRSFIYGAAKEGKAGPAGMMQMSGLGPPGFDEIGTNSAGGGGGAPSSLQIFINGLWLEIESANSNLASLKLHGTEIDTLYEIFSREDLLRETWLSEGTRLGAAGQDWTPFTVPVGDRTNNFFWARSWVDSTGSGIPDWWWLKYFGQATNVDAYGDPDGDGWNNIEEFQNGTHPTTFNTPPAPRGLTVVYHSANGTANVVWQSSSSPITGFTVARDDGAVNDFNFSASINGFEDDVSSEVPNGYFIFDPTIYVTYRIQAHYASGDSAWSDPVSLEQNTVSANFISGPQDSSYLAVSGLPANTVALRFTRSGESEGLYDTNFDMPVSTLTNNLYLVPASWKTPGNELYEWWIQPIDPHGSPGAATYVFNTAVSLYGTDWTPHFFDGRVHLKQNLIFLLRAATFSYPFQFTEIHTGSTPNEYFTNPTNYTFASFLKPFDDGDYPYASINVLQPFENNYRYRNFVFDLSELDTNGHASTGVGGSYAYGVGLVLEDPPAYQFQAPLTNGAPIASVLATNQTRWLCSYALESSSAYLGEIRVTANPPSYEMASAARNIYGLPFLSAYMAHRTSNGLQTPTLYAGNSGSVGGYFYPETAQPQFETGGYDFWQLGVDWLPGHSAFSTSSTNHLMITPVGNAFFAVAGYKKLTIQNGYNDVCAYLGQYFDKAYKMTNGIVTTNTTGILSPYGSFFPTEPGAVALVTMPDIDTGERGTGIVQVVALNVDGNHDGTMNFSFTGPDSVSTDRPFRFWVNDDNDVGETQGDDIPGKPVLDGKIPNGLDNHVNGVRDLIDFFPVYLNIQGLLQAMTTNNIQVSYQFILRQDDSALNVIYTGLLPNDFQSYLKDTNFAAMLADWPVGQITSNGVRLLNGYLYDIRNDGTGMLLVEARTNTSKPLVLEVWKDYTNLIAKAELPLSITSVEQMFRQKNLIRDGDPNSTAGFPDRLTHEEVPNEPENNGKNFVFLHGYNVNPNHARGTFAEVFKRIYWSGSHAKFYGVTWEGNESQGMLGSIPFAKYLTPDYHANLVNAFLTAPKLASFLATLTNGPTTVTAHSLGNMVVLSALNDYNASISNYFMLDAAVAIEAIDGGATPNFHMRHSTWIDPEDYSTRLLASYWWMFFPTNDARSTLTWSNRLGNFHTTQVYNFYSSGEEVLRSYDDDPPLSAFGSATLLVNYWNAHSPLSSYAWVWQEKGKGIAPLDTIMGSTHGGWKFNTNAPYYYMTNGALTHMPNTQASVLSASQLQTNAFFDMNYDYLLFGSLGSTYAQQERNRILSDAIPAMTLPVGANIVPRLQAADRNFDMNSLYQNGWPASRPSTGSEAFKWYHSDFREVAYLYVHKLFDEFVNQGSLK